MTTKANCHQVDCAPSDGSGTTWSQSGTGVALKSYPTLHELDASEIPSAPAAPVIPDGTTTVANKAELQAMNGANSYILTDNIDCTGAWTPIANFTGTLDGDGYTISNLTINSPASDERALFGSVRNGFKCKDVTFDNCSVTGDDEIGILFGDVNLSANNTISISNVHFTNCTVICDTYGGIMGGRVRRMSGSKIYNCSATDCSVSGDTRIGGMFGHFSSYFDDVTGNWISECSSVNVTITNIASSSNKFGGFAGEVLGNASDGTSQILYLYDCYSTGTITITDQDALEMGGFAGYMDFNVFNVSCYSTVDIAITSTVAGDDAEDIGGYLGDESTYSSYINCYSTGDITISVVGAARNVGGFIGYFDGTDITHILRCYTTTNIDITTTTANSIIDIGGFIGEFNFTNVAGARSRDDVIERSWCSGDITTTATSDGVYTVGGFFGLVRCPNGTVVRSYGVQDCYSWSQISLPAASSIAIVGGFIGYCDMLTDQTITLDNCYDAQTDVRTGSSFTDELVYASSTTGGFIGKIDLNGGTVTVTNSFWDTETTGLAATADAGSAGHDTDWMMTKTNYSDAGWAFSTADGVKDDINSIWTIIQSVTSGTSDQYRAVASPQDYAHLEGQVVQILADGIYLDDQEYTIVSGAVSPTYTATTDHVGLKIVSRLQPMKIDGEVHVKRIRHIVPDVYESVAGEYGKELTDMYSMELRDSNDPMDRDGDLHSGYIELPFKGQYDRQGDIWITQTVPLPMTVLGIGVKLSKENI